MSTTHTAVMASVGAIYIGRVLTGTRALKVYALILSVWGIGRLAWVSKIAENFFTVEQRGIGSLVTYIFAAIEHAHLGVLIAVVIASFAAISLFLDFARSIAAPGSARFAA